MALALLAGGIGLTVAGPADDGVPGPSRVDAATGTDASPAFAAASRTGVCRMLEQILAPWPTLQSRNGTFPDALRANDARGRSRGYDEAMMGHVLLRWGRIARDARATRSGLAALARETDPRHRARADVFRAYAAAAAYRDAKRAGILRSAPALARRWRGWLARYEPTYMSWWRPFSNQRTIEAAAYRRLLATGVASSHPQAVLADRAGAVRALHDYERTLDETAARWTRSGVALFSERRTSLAYVALTAAFLGRYIATAPGPVSPGVRSSFRRLTRGLLSATGPDGDIAYAGRSQAESWALSLGAYAALQAARGEPEATLRARFRELAARYLERLQRVHMPQGTFWLAPILRSFDP